MIYGIILILIFRYCYSSFRQLQNFQIIILIFAVDQKYLFDWSIPLYCPELLDELIIPRYFTDDFLQLTPPGSLYRESWPSLFIAPAGANSSLHVDTFGSNFWMALFEGKKR